MNGWYAMKRGWMDHEIFNSAEPYTRREAWIWIVENACYAPTQVDIGGKPHTVPRGSLCFSERFLSAKWGWSKTAVRTFIRHLESHGVIEVAVVQTGSGAKAKRNQISLCNYDKYQARETKTQPKRNQNETKEEQGNNIPVGTGADAPAENARSDNQADPVKQAFDGGIKMLGETGIPDKKARSLVGKWVSANGPEAVLVALGRAQREGAIEPVSFIEGCLKFSRKRQEPEPGEVRTIGGVRKVYRPFDGWVPEYA